MIVCWGNQTTWHLCQSLLFRLLWVGVGLNVKHLECLSKLIFLIYKYVRVMFVTVDSRRTAERWSLRGRSEINITTSGLKDIWRFAINS